MDPITFVALTVFWKRRLNQRIVKSKNLLILYSGKTQSNLNDFKQQDIMHHAGHSIINLLYLACLCITIYFKQHRQCLIMMVIQITPLVGFNSISLEYRKQKSCTTQSAWHSAHFHLGTGFVYTAAVMAFFCLGLVWCCCCCLPPSPV